MRIRLPTREGKYKGKRGCTLTLRKGRGKEGEEIIDIAFRERYGCYALFLDSMILVIVVQIAERER